MTRPVRLILPILLLTLAALACDDSADVPASPTADPPTASPQVGSSSIVPHTGRLLGLAVNETADGDFDRSFEAAQATGMQVVSLGIHWDEVEVAPGVYDPDPNWLAIVNAFYPAVDMQVALTLTTIDTVNIRLPADLVDRSFDDPLVIERFNAYLDYVHTQIPNVDLVALAIGNEIDGVLGSDPEAYAAYETFFAATADHAQELWPDVPVGTTSMYNGLTNYAVAPLQSVNRHANAVFVTYYPLDDAMHPRDPSTVAGDVGALVNLYPDRSIFFVEAGYPSSESCGGSEAAQADFVREMFTAWDAHYLNIDLVLFDWLNDVPEATVRDWTDYYGLSARCFRAFLGSLGLRDQNGVPKPAFEALVTEASVRGWVH